MDKNYGNMNDFYMYSTRNRDVQNTVDMLIEDKPVNVTIIIDSGATVIVIDFNVGKNLNS